MASSGFKWIRLAVIAYVPIKAEQQFSLPAGAGKGEGIEKEESPYLRLSNITPFLAFLLLRTHRAATNENSFSLCHASFLVRGENKEERTSKI